MTCNKCHCKHGKFKNGNTRKTCPTKPPEVQRTSTGKKGTGIYDRVVNKLTGSNLKDGEKHAILYTKDGFKAASFMGPGSHVVDRLQKKTKPITKSDKTAQAHDIRYSLAKNTDDVRAADIKMVEKLAKIAKEGSDYKFNIYMGKLPIQMKMKLEDWGLLSKTAFTKAQGVKNEADRPILESNLKALEQEGYGAARSLRLQTLNKKKKKKKKKKNCKRNKTKKQYCCKT